MSSNKSNVVLDRISFINLNNNDESINQRLRYYSAALKSIRMNPILGVGVGNWKFISIKYDSKKCQSILFHTMFIMISYR